MDSHSETQVGALISDLEHSEKRVIRAAVDALLSLAPRSPRLRDALHQRMGEPHVKNAWAIAYILAQLPQPSPEAIQRLLDGLGHQDADVRWAISLLLVRLVKNEPEILRRVLQLCATGNGLQRRMAIYCLRDLNLQDTASAQVFSRALSDPDPLVRIAGAAGLKTTSHLDVREQDALLTVFLEDLDNRVRSVAAITLAQRGTPSEELLRALNRAESSESEQLKRAASAALALLKSKRAAPAGS